MSDFFINDKFKVLDCMAQRQIPVKDAIVIKLSQQEIADILKFTKTKVNMIIGELKENGYIIQCGSRGKYILTEKANVEIKSMKDREV